MTESLKTLNHLSRSLHEVNGMLNASLFVADNKLFDLLEHITSMTEKMSAKVDCLLDEHHAIHRIS